MLQKPDLSLIEAAAAEAEALVTAKMDAVDIAAADLARIVGPLATAHRLAMLTMDFMEIAKKEGQL